MLQVSGLTVFPELRMDCSVRKPALEKLKSKSVDIVWLMHAIHGVRFKAAAESKAQVLLVVIVPRNSHRRFRVVWFSFSNCHRFA
ncbi:hypothetical protein NPIL_532781 [Nephila pilipes]|uniref:Uncharacterized protein n=1 Tax=Nephila pilipes TaxID=299642 RepID=A0A8X6T8K1_NEPPI|nr:hypothetical protein NPIL_454281 [Nephila pilipes]GFT29875.1 hypothetical protein NPIL_532781 [Nephila pilipes]